LPQGAKNPATEAAGFIAHRDLYGALNLAAAKATGAGVDMLGTSVHNGLYALDVGLPCTIGTPVGMADLNAERHILTTILTLCHLLLHLPALCNLFWFRKEQLYYNSRWKIKNQAFFQIFISHIFLQLQKQNFCLKQLPKASLGDKI
jgi:hypothetical protein